ncbi:3558_t:CDS:2, partial [Dentiscutata heterogama]
MEDIINLTIGEKNFTISKSIIAKKPDGKEIEIHEINDRNAYIFENFVLPYYEKNILPKYSYQESFTKKEFIDEISFWNINTETLIERCVSTIAIRIGTLIDLLLEDIEKKLIQFINEFDYCFWYNRKKIWSTELSELLSSANGFVFELMEHYGDEICKKIKHILNIDCEVKIKLKIRTERYLDN